MQKITPQKCHTAETKALEWGNMVDKLLPQHIRLIEESGIEKGVAQARGYRSVTAKAELVALGFGRNQCRVPALLIPIYDTRGDLVTYQLRPDNPRINDRGKPVKYETPRGTSMVIDVPPPIRHLIANPNVPLIITEGVRKADSAASRGLCCIDILGVWNWRGTNEYGGKTALADWENIALEGREVYLCFDSDVVRKPEVHQALHRLKAFLESRKANVRVIRLPDGDDGAKVGLDDYLASGRTTEELFALAQNTLPAPPPREEESPYMITPAGETVWVRRDGDSERITKLANFNARIIEDCECDDGAEVQRVYVIEAELGRVKRTCRVLANQFAGMNWVAQALGAEAIIASGQTTKDRLREAIQLRSAREGIAKRRVFTHTGWREVIGRRVFLHAGGAVGPDGAEDGVEVELQHKLDRFRLPAPPEDPRDAVLASLRFLQVAPPAQTWPLLAAAYTAPLGEIMPLDFVVWVYGPTGSQKSSTAALLSCHFGRFERNNLPGNFVSTHNSLEEMMWLAKDVLFVVDDFAPAPDPSTSAQVEGTAYRILRSVGDSHPRNRMTPDGRLRASKPPRCLVVATGELAPPGTQSAVARTIEVEWEAGSVDLERLSAAQAEADRYAEAMSAYVQWIAGNFDRVRKTAEQIFGLCRKRFASQCTHARLAETAAKLAVGAHCFLWFAVEVGALSRGEATAKREEMLNALSSCLSSTDAQVRTLRPSLAYLSMLFDMIAQGEAYLEAKQGGAPQDGRKWGWLGDRPKPTAQKVGWVNEAENLVYLLPEASVRAVKKYANGADVRFSWSAREVGKDLLKSGFLQRTEEQGSRCAEWINGRTVRVWVIACTHISDPIPKESARTARTARQEEGEQQQTSVNEDRQSAPCRYLAELTDAAENRQGNRQGGFDVHKQQSTQINDTQASLAELAELADFYNTPLQ
jgi:hypothetical protein